jgi:hypothetical protein
MEPGRRNQWQSLANRTAPKARKPSEIRCCGLPPVAATHGKEGVDGSSPSDGFDKSPANWPIVLSDLARLSGAGTRRVHIPGTGGHSRASATSGVASRHGQSLPWSRAIQEISLHVGALRCLVGQKPGPVGFRNSVSLTESVHQLDPPQTRLRRLSGIDQSRPTLGAADGSSAFDVDPADLIFARA